MAWDQRLFLSVRSSRTNQFFPNFQALEGDEVIISAALAVSAEAFPTVCEVSFQSDNPLFMEFAAVMVSVGRGFLRTYFHKPDV